jgi:hypothetical protein
MQALQKTQLANEPISQNPEFESQSPPSEVGQLP